MVLSCFTCTNIIDFSATSIFDTISVNNLPYMIKNLDSYEYSNGRCVCSNSAYVFPVIHFDNTPPPGQVTANPEPFNY